MTARDLRRIGPGSTLAHDLAGFHFPDVLPVRSADCFLVVIGEQPWWLIP